MKLCIVIPCNIHVAPFYWRYVKLIKEQGLSFDLIFWDRTGIIMETQAQNNYPYQQKDSICSGNVFKVFKYIGFSRFARKIIKENNYDKVICLTTNSAILLYDILLNSFNRKYLLDIRDYTLEEFRPYFNMVKKLVENSGDVIISSKGFKKFLPDWNYTIAHNFDLEVLAIANHRRSRRNQLEKIHISFVGTIRFFNENQKLLRSLGNDERFKLQYFGENSEKIMEFCIQHGYNNIDYAPRFNYSETLYYYETADTINNIYGNENIQLTTALSNKLYYAAILKIPIIVCKGTYMEQISTKYGIGCPLDLNASDVGDYLYNWYHNVNWESFEDGCNEFMSDVLKEDETYEHNIKKFLVG